MEVQKRLIAQQEELECLKKQVAGLEERLAQAGSRPLYHIDRLEYHFDQLKVQKLEGTLNIGMTPPGDGASAAYDIDQLSAAPVNVFPAAESTITVPGAPFPEIRANLDTYFNEEAPERLIGMEREMNLELDPFHRRIIIEDIRKQVPARIKYYVTQARTGEADGPKEAGEGDSLIASVTAKTIRDAEAAMRQYLSQLAGSTVKGGDVS